MLRNFTTKVISLVAIAVAASANAQCVVNSNLDEFTSLCPGTTSVSLEGEVGAGDSFIWYTDGTGTFADENSLTTTYTFSQEDLESESITISLVNLDCGLDPDAASTGSFLPFTANAGADFDMCENGSIVVGDGFGLPSWSTSGTGTFDLGAEGATFAPLYYPSVDDIQAGSVTLTLTIADITETCADATDDVVVTLVQSAATIDAGSDTDLEETGVTLSASASGATDLEWSSLDGDGTFDDNTSLTATYTPGSEDIGYGYVELVLSGDGGGCVVSDVVLLGDPASTKAAKGAEAVSISPNPVVNRTEINLGKNYSGNVVISIYNTSGMEVYSETKAVNGTTIVLDQLENLKTGVYQLNIKGESKSFTSRLVKM